MGHAQFVYTLFYVPNAEKSPLVAHASYNKIFARLFSFGNCTKFHSPSCRIRDLSR